MWVNHIHLVTFMLVIFSFPSYYNSFHLQAFIIEKSISSANCRQVPQAEKKNSHRQTKSPRFSAKTVLNGLVSKWSIWDWRNVDRGKCWGVIPLHRQKNYASWKTSRLENTPSLFSHRLIPAKTFPPVSSRPFTIYRPPNESALTHYCWRYKITVLIGHYCKLVSSL